MWKESTSWWTKQTDAHQTQKQNHPTCVCVQVGGGSNEDDLTTQLVEILQINHSVRMLLAGGGQQPSIMEQWGFEQAQVCDCD